MVEHRLAKARVASSESRLALLFDKLHTMREWLSGRASPCQGEGREFESRLALRRIGFEDNQDPIFSLPFFLTNRKGGLVMFVGICEATFRAEWVF